MTAKFYIDTRIKASIAVTKEEWADIFAGDYDFVAGVDDDFEKLYPAKTPAEVFEEIFKQFFVESPKRFDPSYSDIVCLESLEA